MRKGEKIIVAAMLASVVVLVIVKVKKVSEDEGEDPGIPFYSTSSPEVEKLAAKSMHLFDCKKCHSIWGMKAFTQSVPAPSLDGMGMFRTEEWLYNYFSAENPQKILPSRLKKEYRMPSLSSATEQERRALAKYIAGLKVEDWYFEEAKKARYEKLTGKEYKENES
ncbi:MAG TPA: cytochrome c [Gammaproteobacteria bacterium]|nr:cytochrome c [Gammaproteobacteria bacterium]